MKEIEHTHNEKLRKLEYHKKNLTLRSRSKEKDHNQRRVLQAAKNKKNNKRNIKINKNLKRSRKNKKSANDLDQIHQRNILVQEAGMEGRKERNKKVQRNKKKVTNITEID